MTLGTHKAAKSIRGHQKFYCKEQILL